MMSPRNFTITLLYMFSLLLMFLYCCIFFLTKDPTLIFILSTHYLIGFIYCNGTHDEDLTTRLGWFLNRPFQHFVE